MTASPELVAGMMGLAELEAFPPRYNIAPSQPILIIVGEGAVRTVRANPPRVAKLARWGLLPAWVRDPEDFSLLFSVRSETAATKNAFRGAITHRRCLVPATGFYEWKRPATGGSRTRPYFIAARNEGPFAFAGLMETYLAPDGSEIDTAAILTRNATGALAAIHQRMPVVVQRDDYERWLDCRSNTPNSVAAILTGGNDMLFTAIRVSDKINNVANLGPAVQEQVPEEEGEDCGSDAPAATARLGRDGPSKPVGAEQLNLP